MIRWRRRCGRVKTPSLANTTNQTSETNSILGIFDKQISATFLAREMHDFASSNSRTGMPKDARASCGRQLRSRVASGARQNRGTTSRHWRDQSLGTFWDLPRGPGITQIRTVTNGVHSLAIALAQRPLDTVLGKVARPRRLAHPGTTGDLKHRESVGAVEYNSVSLNVFQHPASIAAKRATLGRHSQSPGPFRQIRTAQP